MSKSPAVDIARRQQDGDGIVTLSTGVRVRLRPIPPGTLAEARSAIQLPSVPTWSDPDKDRETPNPNDPQYREAMMRYHQEQLKAQHEVMLMLGVELIDGVPQDDDWLRNLHWLARHGRIDLSGYDLSDPVDREFIYKKHYAMGANDWDLLWPLMGVTRGEVEREAANFPGNGT